jgi:hypothetical protein
VVADKRIQDLVDRIIENGKQDPQIPQISRRFSRQAAETPRKNPKHQALNSKQIQIEKGKYRNNLDAGSSPA